MKMTMEEMHRELCALIGYSNFRITTRYNGINDYEALCGDYNGICCDLPPLTLDLCAEAEKKLDVNIHSGDSPRYRYARELYNLVPPDQQPFRATSQQRCEAILRTVGRWRE